MWPLRVTPMESWWGSAGFHDAVAPRRGMTNCLEAQDAQEGAPSGVRDGLRQVVVLQQVGRLQVFYIDGVVLPHEGECRFVMEVLPLALHYLMRFSQQFDCLTAALTALLATRYSALRAL